MTVLRDLVSRITFRTDKSALVELDHTLNGVKSTIARIAGPALSAWAIHAGNNVQLLHSQFNAFEKGGISPLRDEIARLQQNMGGKTSIFDEKTLMQTAVGLRQMGFESKEAAELMKFAASAVVRAGGDFAGAAQSIGSGIMQGGAVDALKSLGLITEEAARSLNFLEQQVAIDPFGAFARQYRTGVLDVVRKATPELQEEFMSFLKKPGTGAEMMRTTTQFQNVWTEVTHTVTDSLGPAFNAIAVHLKDFVGYAKDFHVEINKTLPVVEKVVGIVERVIGLKPTVPLSANEVDEFKAFERKPDEGTMSWLWRMMTSKPPSISMPARPMPSQPAQRKEIELEDVTPTGGNGERRTSALDWSGDINIYTNATDPSAVAAAVRTEMERMSHRAVQRFLPSTESAKG